LRVPTRRGPIGSRSIRSNALGSDFAGGRFDAIEHCRQSNTFGRVELFQDLGLELERLGSHLIVSFSLGVRATSPRSTRACAARLTVTLSIRVATPNACCVIPGPSAITAIRRHSGILSPNSRSYAVAIAADTRLDTTESR